MMKLSDYDYHLPEELIAQTPVYPRDSSKLMVLNRKEKSIENRNFRDITDYLVKGDLLVVNSTRVIPARLIGKKDNGVAIEIFLLKRLDSEKWECLVKPGKRLKVGSEVFIGDELSAIIEEIKEDGNRVVKFKFKGIFEEVISKIGEMPLPPYIKEQLKEKDRYQTVYAKEGESVAAPTAGLHFTEELLQKIKDMDIEIAEVFLDVGIGTFRPVKTENLLEHKMHEESYFIPDEAAEKIKKAKTEGRRVIAVGTTSVRTIESAAMATGEVKSIRDVTDIFIYPGYKFRVTDAMITNFHLPKSTLLMLISAFADKEFILKAYKKAVEDRYRFFSFGDAMFIY
jgi:S-adenosylmethionine:tRNA ribosyltransferase-isomerase